MRHSILILVGILAISVSCTNFKEEDASVSLSADLHELSFGWKSTERQLTVSSGSRWYVSMLPSWISLESIDGSTRSPYEWGVNFLAEENDEYNREGTVEIRNETGELIDIAVKQNGAKGIYVALLSLKINPEQTTIIEGQSEQLSVRYSPTNASDKQLIWTSSNSDVAQVSEAGLLTAKSVGIATITARSEDGVHSAKCLVTVVSKTINVTGISLDKTSLSMTEGDTETLTATVLPSDATDKSVTWSSNNTSVALVSSDGLVTAKAAGTATITVKTNDGGKIASCSVIVNDIKNGFVDLGLSVKWATCNLGSVLPSDYGNYYAWGEISPKTTSFQPLDYKWFKSIYFGVDSQMGCDRYFVRIEKYVFDSAIKYEIDKELGFYLILFTEEFSEGYSFEPVKYDNQLCLKQEDDAARWEKGEGWRIPTDEEWKELIEKCDWTPSSNNGVDGYIVSSKTGAASIFLPKAGWMRGNDIIDQGRYGDYWSSSLSGTRTFVAKSISCGQSGINIREGWYRYSGLTIRPVYTK